MRPCLNRKSLTGWPPFDNSEGLGRLDSVVLFLSLVTDQQFSGMLVIDSIQVIFFFFSIRSLLLTKYLWEM